MTRSSEELLAAGRARLMRDTDPAIVEAGRLSRLAFAERIGSPRRCDSRPSECHPADGSCLYCGAWNGENCLAALRSLATKESEGPRWRLATPD